MLDDLKHNSRRETIAKYKSVCLNHILEKQINTGAIEKFKDMDEISCLLRSEVQDYLDSLVNGCRTCQSLLNRENKINNEGVRASLMSPIAISQLEKFVKLSAGELNELTDDFRTTKNWENKLVTEFGVVLEDFSAKEVFVALKEIL